MRCSTDCWACPTVEIRHHGSSSVEGRDHMSGDTFIMIGAEGDRREDLYLSRDSGPADTPTHDLIAEARNALPVLIEEIMLGPFGWLTPRRNIRSCRLPCCRA